MKVLTIDLDYIMGPTINHYENVWWHDNPGKRWDLFFKYETKIKSSDLYYDKDNLFYIYRVFLNLVKRGVDISFGYDHDNILFDIGDKTDLEVVNIDHHHDVLYSTVRKPDKETTVDLKAAYHDVKDHSNITEGSWVAWLRSQNKLNSYTWITDHWALEKYEERERRYITGLIPRFKIKSRDEYDVLSEDWDHLHMCLSPQYVPPDHWHLYTMFYIAYEEYTGKKVNLHEISNKKFEMFVRHQNVTNEILH